MATQYTSILQLALPVTGELSGTWGDVVNDEITSMIEEAIAGMATISSWTGASHTLTTADGLTDEARCAMLVASGAPGASATIVCPARTKAYIVTNNVTGGYTVTLKTAAGTGVSVPNGSSAFLYCNGVDVVTAVTPPSFNSPLAVVGNSTAGAEIRLPEDTDNGSNYVALKAPDALASNLTFTLPAADGTNGQLISTDGSGQLAFTSVSFNTPLTVVGNNTAGAEIRLPEDTDNGSNYVALKSPDALASNLTFTLPSADGTSGQAIVTNGSGQLSFGSTGVSTGKAVILSMVFGF